MNNEQSFLKAISTALPCCIPDNSYKEAIQDAATLGKQNEREARLSSGEDVDPAGRLHRGIEPGDARHRCRRAKPRRRARREALAHRARARTTAHLRRAPHSNADRHRKVYRWKFAGFDPPGLFHVE